LAEAAKANATARQLKGFQSQVAELTARLDNLRRVLPEEKHVGDVVARLQKEKDVGVLSRRLKTRATQSNLTIRGFKPAPIVQKPTHAEWPIQLELDGTDHNLGLFLARVSKVARIMHVA